MVAVVKESVAIPVAVKLSPFFSALPNLAARLERIGADGLVLFNRFYQADIDTTTRGTDLLLQLSDSSDLLLRLHAMAILSGRTRLSLGLSGGVHEPIDAIKAVMAGAHVVQLVSTLLRHGPHRLALLRKGFETWMADHQLRIAGRHARHRQHGGTRRCRPVRARDLRRRAPVVDAGSPGRLIAALP